MRREEGSARIRSRSCEVVSCHVGSVCLRPLDLSETRTDAARTRNRPVTRRGTRRCNSTRCVWRARTEIMTPAPYSAARSPALISSSHARSDVYLMNSDHATAAVVLLLCVCVHTMLTNCRAKYYRVHAPQRPLVRTGSKPLQHPTPHDRFFFHLCFTYRVFYPRVQSFVSFFFQSIRSLPVNFPGFQSIPFWSVRDSCCYTAFSLVLRDCCGGRWVFHIFKQSTWYTSSVTILVFRVSDRPCRLDDRQMRSPCSR